MSAVGILLFAQFAVELDPAPRGSEWFVADSLAIAGNLKPTLGAVLSYANRPVVIEQSPIVEHLLVTHLGGSVGIGDRLRLALDLPVQLLTHGRGAPSAPALPAPPHEQGVGDLRLAADARVFGRPGDALVVAGGVELWAPTGQKSQWMSDGVFRLRPRIAFAGERDMFVYAGSLGVGIRETSDIGFELAAGVRVQKNIVLGPELFGSTTFHDAFGQYSTPIELVFGGHYLTNVGNEHVRIGAGFGRGLTEAFGSPDMRALFSLEWLGPELDFIHIAPILPEPPEPDSDQDGIPDSRDACPRVIGMRSDDPKKNGCPPDEDDDGIDDVHDACPTIKGIQTDDPRTNGCPDLDRDHDGIPNEEDACPGEPGPANPMDPRRNGCPLAFVSGSRIELGGAIRFRPNGAELLAEKETDDVLASLRDLLTRRTEIGRIKIEAHTDDRGESANNKRVAAARAEAVAKWLMDHGIDQRRITTEGIGGDRPIDTNETEAGRAANRRIEIRIVQ
jgi:outer membrane protein OmpA-like peptidoglycan-associated protein